LNARNRTNYSAPPPPQIYVSNVWECVARRGRKRFIASWGLRMSHICPCTPCPSPPGYRSKVESRLLPTSASGILSLSAKRRRCRTSQLTDYRVQEYRLPSPPSFKSNVLRESLSVESQNIPCATLKGSWL
jgi:hypothetical protein